MKNKNKNQLRNGNSKTQQRERNYHKIHQTRGIIENKNRDGIQNGTNSMAHSCNSSGNLAPSLGDQCYLIRQMISRSNPRLKSFGFNLLGRHRFSAYYSHKLFEPNRRFEKSSLLYRTTILRLHSLFLSIQKIIAQVLLLGQLISRRVSLGSHFHFLTATNISCHSLFGIAFIDATLHNFG